MKLPDYIIIGETKCGTTSLFNYLIRHPQVLDTYGNGDKLDSSYASKEIRFFDRYYDRGLEWYKSCFPDTNEGQITGEATPMYMYRTTALRRIFDLIPDVKLIIQLRNPVDRLYSNFNHNSKWVPGWTDKYRSFEDFINSAHDPDYYIIDKGIYYYSLLKWYNYFPHSQFHIIITEELHQNPDTTYNGLLKFLDIEPHTLENYNRFRKLNYLPMNNKTRDLLLDFYRPYNNKLSELLNKKLDWDN